MKGEEQTNDAPPTTGSSTITIEGVEYTYTINKDEKENEIIIQLSEAKPDKYITFMYRSSAEKIVKTIKLLLVCENIDEMIISLHDIFINGNITVEKKDEKYIMKIEATGFGKKTKYEIELEKNDPVIDDNTKILNKIKEIDENYQKIKEEINHIKSQNNQMTYNEEERNKIIKEIKNELNIKEILKDLLINDKDIINIFESKLNNQKNEDNNKIEESVNKIIKEKYSNKVDIETYNEDINKINEFIKEQTNEI